MLWGQMETYLSSKYEYPMLRARNTEELLPRNTLTVPAKGAMSEMVAHSGCQYIVCPGRATGNTGKTSEMTHGIRRPHTGPRGQVPAAHESTSETSTWTSRFTTQL